MIEIVFSDSAHGALKAAQHCGEGAFPGGIAGVFVCHGDGGKPTEEEIQQARRQAEEQARLEWAAAVPMGGDPEDVCGFSFGLSIGDISEDVPGEKRRQALEWLYSIHPYFEEAPAFTNELMQKGAGVLKEVCSRICSGEGVRIWFSNQPDEMCGLHWFMAHINKLAPQSGQVILVELPDWEALEDGSIRIHTGWGGIKPGDWGRYLALQRPAAPGFCSSCASHWKRLQKENAPLRAVLNGRLVSMPETLYDEFILREIEAEEDEFHEAMVIGRVLGKYELGVGDAWVAHRIEAVIAAGRLIPVTEPAPGSPIYHRRLRKRR